MAKRRDLPYGGLEGHEGQLPVAIEELRETLFEMRGVGDRKKREWTEGGKDQWRHLSIFWDVAVANGGMEE